MRSYFACLFVVAIPAMAARSLSPAPLSVLAQVRDAADKITEPYARGALLGGVAEAQAVAGDLIASSQTIASIRGEEGSWARAHALTILALAQVASGDDAAARQAASSIPDDKYYRGFFRAQALTAVAAADAKSGKRAVAREMFQQAVDLASKQSPTKGDYGTPRGAALTYLAKNQAEAGWTDDALQTAKLLDDQELLEALAAVGRARAEAGDEAGARRAAQSLGDSDEEASVFVAIAGARVRAGDKKGAEFVLKQMRRVGKSSSEIARVFTEAGDLPSALNVAEFRAESLAAIAGDLAAIAEVLYSKGDAKDVKEVVRVANSLGVSISLKDEALEEIAAVQAQAGDIPGARQTADGITDKYWKEISIAEIAKAEVARGDLINALQTASSIRDGNERYEAYEPLARALVRAHDVPRALKLATSFGPEPFTLHARILVAIAETQAQMGDMSGAHENVSKIQDDCVDSEEPVAAEEVKAGDAKGAVVWALSGGSASAAILRGVVDGVKDQLKTKPSNRGMLEFKFIELSAEKGCY